jgi:hypothetical protein
MCALLQHATNNHLFWRLVQVCSELFRTNDGASMAFQRRPGVGAFLARVAQMFEVVLFTAGSKACPQPLTPRPLPRHLLGTQAPAGLLPATCCRSDRAQLSQRA